MYIFITYAREGMKGVQVRGLRVAKHMPKKEVMFINGGNSEWIEKAGYKYENHNFNKFNVPSKIKFPNNTKCIIFCDLPTNRAFQISIFIAANEKKIPCVVLDNIYREKQDMDAVYQNIKNYSDSLILNGLNFFDKNKSKKTSIVPPLIDDSLILGKNKKYAKKIILEKLKEKDNSQKIIFGIGYNDSIYKEIIKISDYFKKKKHKTTFIIVSKTKKIKKKGCIIEIPSLNGDEVSLFIKASDLIICKAGYLQIVESLAMEVPVVAIGEVSLISKNKKIEKGKGTSGFNKDWLDKKIIDATVLAKVVSIDLCKKIEKILFSAETRRKIIKKIKLLHNGNLNGAEITANLIKKTKFKPKNFPKILILSLDKKQETEKVKELLKEYPFALPIYVSIPFFTNVFNRNLHEYDPTPKKEALHYNPSLIFSFDYDSLHSFSKILPWYQNLFDIIENFVKNSDKCIVVGKETYNYLEETIKKYKKKIKIIDNNFKYNVRGK